MKTSVFGYAVVAGCVSGDKKFLLINEEGFFQLQVESFFVPFRPRTGYNKTVIRSDL